MVEKEVLEQRAWDVFVSLCATASALMIPYNVVMGFTGAPYVGTVAWVVAGVFAVDVVVRYRRDAEQRPPAVLAVELTLDVLAALPIHAVLGAASPLVMVRLLKLYRVAQFMYRWSRRQVYHANALRLAFFAYWLALAAHGITCGWVALHVGAGPPIRYLDALYWCVTTLTTVGYGDVTPATDAQTLYAIFVMILGVGVYAYVIGNIATILTNIDPTRTRYLQQRERLTAFMAYRNLPRSLQRRIFDYYDYLWDNRLVYDESTILDDLPPSLKTDVALFLKRNLLKNVPLFRDASDAFIREVALKMDSIVCLPGDYVVRAGEPGRDMFFINQGTVEIRSPDGQTIYRTLSDGEFFGEIALFFKQPRTASARAITYCDLYRLDDDLFERVLEHFPDVAAEIEALAHQRHSDETAAIGDG